MREKTEGQELCSEESSTASEKTSKKETIHRFKMVTKEVFEMDDEEVEIFTYDTGWKVITKSNEVVFFPVHNVVWYSIQHYDDAD